MRSRAAAASRHLARRPLHSLPSSTRLPLARSPAASSLPPSPPTSNRSARPPLCHVRHASSVSQRPGSDHVHFPGALNSKFTTSMQFIRPSEHSTIPTYRCMDPDGIVLDAEHAPKDVSPEEMVGWYKTMVSVSIMDLIMFEAQRQGRISFYMVSAGEEGIAVGSAAALTKDDVVFAQYRETGVFAQRGFELKDFMNQLFSNQHDTGKGRNMPVHYGSQSLNHHTISSTLATQIPHAAGAAYALKLQRHMTPADPPPPRIVACYFGEGAASEGDFHAALNMAATRACPIVFVCRNNGFAISTPTLEQYRGDGIASRGVGYGIDTLRVDGNDIFAVRAAMQAARTMALGADAPGAEPRPVLLEAMSYRVSHHSTSDDSFAYRARADVEDWKRRDNPIVRLRKYLERQGLWDEEREQRLRSTARQEVLDAVKVAETMPKPPIADLFTDVYEELSEESKDHMRQLRDVLERYQDEYDLESYVGGIDSLKDV